MKVFLKKFTGITLAAALMCTSLAVAPEVSAAKKAKKIIMNTKVVNLTVGEKFTLKVKKVTPKKASKKVTYKVDKKGKSVIKVTKKGVITALAAGKATVKVTSKTNKKAKANVKVVVREAAPAPAPTETAAVTVTETPKATATVEPVAATEAPTNSPRPTRTPRPTPGPPTPSPTPKPPVIGGKVVKLATPIIVDGIADEAWADVPLMSEGTRIAIDNGADSDTTATFKFAWDENNLYGFVTVKDSDVDATGSKTYERDGVDFYMDEDNSKPSSFTAAGEDAFQYRLTGLTKDDDGNKQTALKLGFEEGSDATREAYAGIEMEYAFTSDGYTVEFKVPFMKAKSAGTVIGFDSLVYDCAEGLRNAEIYMHEATRTMSYWNLSDALPEYTLVDSE